MMWRPATMNIKPRKAVRKILAPLKIDLEVAAAMIVSSYFAGASTPTLNLIGEYPSVGVIMEN
jgi:hypothetical protein